MTKSARRRDAFVEFQRQQPVVVTILVIIAIMCGIGAYFLQTKERVYEGSNRFIVSAGQEFVLTAPGALPTVGVWSKTPATFVRNGKPMNVKQTFVGEGQGFVTKTLMLPGVWQIERVPAAEVAVNFPAGTTQGKVTIRGGGWSHMSAILTSILVFGVVGAGLIHAGSIIWSKKDRPPLFRPYQLR